MTETKPEIVQAEPLPPFVVEALASNFVLHSLVEAGDPTRLIAETAPTARGLAVDGAADAALIAAYPKLEIIACNSVGVDGIDLEAAKARGVIVTNTPGVLTDCVADMAFALLLAATRRIVEGDRLVRAGEWPLGEPGLGWRATGKRLGIIGLGRIGRTIARRAAGFEMSVAYHGRYRQDDIDLIYHADPISLAAESDILVLSCPGGDATRHLVDGRVLAALGPDGILVNVARGSVVDEAALVAALANRTIRAAGLDVFQDEPNVPAELFALENVVLAPHQASATVETRRAMGELLVENLVRHFAGEPVLTPVE